MAVVLYHNPRCSKSRATLALLQERGISPTVVEYLRTPLSEADIIALIGQLAVPPQQLVRASGPAFEASGLRPDEDDPQRSAAALARWPEMLQRPIVVHNGQARIGRPPAAVLEIL